MFELCPMCLLYLGAFAVLVLSGCSESRAPTEKIPPPKSASQSAPAPEHAHPTEGPHHGELVELGNEEYHAEIVHGSAGEVTVYVLNEKAVQAVPIDSREVTINLTHENQAKQYKLAAAPDENDPPGQASRFTLADEDLSRNLDEHEVTAKLVIPIQGKSYTGKIVHRHSDDEHEKHP